MLARAFQFASSRAFARREKNSLRAIEAPVSALIVMFSRSGSNFVRSANFEIPMSLLACSSRVCVPVNGTRQRLRVGHLVERLVHEARRAEPADDVLDVAVLVIVVLAQHRELVLRKPEPEQIARLGHDLADVVGEPVREVLELRDILEHAAHGVVDEARDRALQPQRLALARLVVRLVDPLLSAVHPHLPLQQLPDRVVPDRTLQREQARGAEAGHADGGGHASADRCPDVGSGLLPLLRVRCGHLPVLPARPPRSQRG